MINKSLLIIGSWWINKVVRSDEVCRWYYHDRVIYFFISLSFYDEDIKILLYIIVRVTLLFTYIKRYNRQIKIILTAVPVIYAYKNIASSG